MIIPVSAIHLVREGNYAVVKVEVDGRWTEVCREYFDGNFSHIVESGGINRRIIEAPP